MKPYVLTVTLNPAKDKTIFVPNFEIGKDFREKALSATAGGKGINVSRVLRVLRVPNLATGFLGGTTGCYIKQQLDKEKIKYDFCEIGGNTRTSLTILDPALSTITRLLERGPQITKNELRKFKKKYLSLLKNCSYVILSGKNIPGAPSSFYQELIIAAAKKKIKTVFDTSGAPFTLGLRAKPFMIKPNWEELEVLVGRKLSSLSKIKQALCPLYRQGIKIVAMTMGSSGAIVFNGKETLFVSPPKVKRKSPVGCGDAFIAGFIASLVSKKSFAESVKLAVACGAANALGINPGFITQATIRKMLKQVTLRFL